MQASAGTLKSHAVLELLVDIMEEPVFDTLRTKEQLGYTVFAVFRNSFGVLGFSITICAQVSQIIQWIMCIRETHVSIFINVSGQQV